MAQGNETSRLKLRRCWSSGGVVEYWWIGERVKIDIDRWFLKSEVDLGLVPSMVFSIEAGMRSRTKPNVL